MENVHRPRTSGLEPKGSLSCRLVSGPAVLETTELIGRDASTDARSSSGASQSAQ